MRSSRVAAVTVLAATALAGCPFVTSGEGVGFVGSTSSGSGSGGAGGHGPGAVTSSSGATSSSSGQQGCKEGDMIPCYTGMPVTSENFMPCQAGVATCQADGGLGPCMGDVTPQPDNCASKLNAHCDPMETPCTGTVSSTSSRAWGENLDDEGLGVAIDKDGNTIVAGLFNGTLDFGNGPKTTSDVGYADGFVASYLPTGALKWVTQLGTDGTDVVNAVTVDTMNNVFVAGIFHDRITFPSPSTVPAVTGGPGIFVAKLDNTGTVIWAQGFTGDSGDHVPKSIAVTADGSQLAVAGYTAGRLQVGTLTLQTQSTNDIDGFILTLDSSSGNLGWVRWVKEDNQGSFQSLNGVAFASDKSVVVAGAGMGSVELGVGSALTTHGNGTNVVVAQYNPDGTGPAWSQLVGDDGDVQGANAVAVGAKDDVFLTGQFQKHLAFGTAMLTEVSDAGTLPNAIFVARLDKTGAGIWAQAFTPTPDTDAGTVDSAGLGIAVDKYGIVVGGYFTNALAFGTAAPLGASGRDALVMKLAVTDGSVLWYRQLGGMMDDQVNQVALDPSTQNPLGASVAVGVFTTQINLGNGPVNGKGNFDIFFARLAP